MELIASKVAVLILFGLLKFITGLAPSILLKRLRVHGKKKRWLEKAMGGVLCVGGGVLLATVFVHMLPEVRESLKTAQNQFQKVKNKKNLNQNAKYQNNMEFKSQYISNLLNALNPIFLEPT